MGHRSFISILILWYICKPNFYNGHFFIATLYYHNENSINEMIYWNIKKNAKFKLSKKLIFKLN